MKLLHTSWGASPVKALRLFSVCPTFDLPKIMLITTGLSVHFGGDQVLSLSILSPLELPTPLPLSVRGSPHMLIEISILDEAIDLSLQVVATGGLVIVVLV